MSLEDIDSLSESITEKQEGHIDDHKKIVRGLKSLRASSISADDRKANSFIKGKAPVVTRLQSAMSIQDNSMLSNGTDLNKFQRMKVTVTADTSNLQLVFSNYYWGLSGLNDIYVTASIETEAPPMAIAHPAFFNNGSREVKISADGVAISDPIPLDLVKGQTIWVRTYVRVATSGEKWPLGSIVWQNGDAATGDGDKTLTTGTSGLGSGLQYGTTYVRCYGPSIIVGNVKSGTKVLGLWGDSITVGIADRYSYLFRGWAEPAISAYGLIPYMNISRHSERAAQMNPASTEFTPIAYRHKIRFAEGCTHIVSAYGVNDTGGAYTLEQIKTNLLGIWNDLSKRKLVVGQYTLPPRTTSTDSWTTLANQSTDSVAEPLRLGLNAWLRDGAPYAHSTLGVIRMDHISHPLSVIWETADKAESSRNSGKWRVDQIRTINDISATSGSYSITSATANFTSTDIGSSVRIAGAGASSSFYIASIQSITSSTTVALNQPIGTTVTNATMQMNMASGDGIHPTAVTYTQMSTAFNIDEFLAMTPKSVI